eukprot:GSChrysophyteH1.ASY1.ANO1.1409.1 assembled CDS
MLALLLLLAQICGYWAQQPHIIHILADDLGWAEVGFHNTEAKKMGDVQTPNIDELVSGGLELDRFYTEKICSPSRSSFLSGRHGIHVNQQNVFPEVRNTDDPLGGWQGIPLNMTLFSEKLQSVGYDTHIVGKWDVGMGTQLHSPKSRGFNSWLGYWHHSNDYWTMNQETETCSVENQSPDEGARCVYEESLLVSEVIRILHETATERTKDASSPPLFLFYSPHLVHMPLEPLQAVLEEFKHISDPHRRKMHAMVKTMDTYVGEIVSTLKELNLWEDTLLVFHSDNGGEIMTEFCGGNNYPLRGGKFSVFEGGIRSNAFVTGGALPSHQRGTKSNALMSIADWYSTYLHAAGVEDADITDNVAAISGLPPLDSANCWDVIQGTSSSYGDALVGALINENFYKILLGPENKNFRVDQDILTGALFPNRTSVVIPELHPKTCSREASSGCLYNVFDDPSEENNLAEKMPDLFAEMLERLDEIQSTVYSPIRGHRVAAACEAAKRNGYFWGPFSRSDV